jgi:two-component system, LuxR family, response regulator FixJ
MSETRPLVHLVDDDEAIRRAGSALLRTSGFTVKTYASGIELLAASGELTSGCILLDVRMPEMDGLEVLRALRERFILLPVIIITGHGDVTIAVQAMRAGALNFIEKPFSKKDLLAALKEGFAQLDTAAERQIHADEAKARLHLLTRRERDVLEGLVKGYPNKTIGYDLGISPRTVEIHRANVMLKLQAASFSDLLRTAFAAGVGETQEDTTRVKKPVT